MLKSESYHYGINGLVAVRPETEICIYRRVKTALGLRRAAKKKEAAQHSTHPLRIICLPGMTRVLILITNSGIKTEKANTPDHHITV